MTTAAPEALLYVQIANRIRERILLGEYPAGSRLPTEAHLSTEFAASRTSVREALRVLTSEGLIRTARGSSGGSVVLQVDHREVGRMLEVNMRSMIATRGCSEQEMEEVQELLEVTATWLAAARRTPQHLERLSACIPDIGPGQAPTKEQIDINLRFHYEILEATGNRLMHTFSEPVSVLIYSFFRGQEHQPDYYQQVLTDHRRILRAIESRDQRAAQQAMFDHIRCLRPKNDDGTERRSEFDGMLFGSLTPK